jgi:hypothetical protein
MTQARLPNAPSAPPTPAPKVERSCMGTHLGVPMVRTRMSQQWLGPAMRPVRMVERWFRAWPEDYPSRVGVRRSP